MSIQISMRVIHSTRSYLNCLSIAIHRVRKFRFQLKNVSSMQKQRFPNRDPRVYPGGSVKSSSVFVTEKINYFQFSQLQNLVGPCGMDAVYGANSLYITEDIKTLKFLPEIFGPPIKKQMCGQIQ